VTIDLGTGDGRLPYTFARDDRDRLFVGVDANAAALRGLSGRAQRDGLDNLLYVRATAEALPPELAGASDRVMIVLPWGSLLAAVARPSVEVLRGIRAVCRPGASLTVVLGIDAARDRAEAARLGLPPFDERHLRGALASGNAEAGFAVTSFRTVHSEDLARWPSTWARRLAFGLTRPVFLIEARATPSVSASRCGPPDAATMPER
jgi:16S rRNA (adenine(1408)-N(1))-methyltransferase